MLSVDTLAATRHPPAGEPALGLLSDGWFRASSALCRISLDGGRALLMPLEAGTAPPRELGPASTRIMEHFSVAGSPQRDDDPIDVARLVLDGALEMKTPGGWASGPDAYPAVFPGAPAIHPDDVSYRALRYGDRKGTDDARQLSFRLYTYGALPRSPRRERQIGAAGTIGAVLGMASEGRAGRALHGYIETPHPHWRSWTRCDGGVPAVTTGLTTKLYVSPAPEAVGACLGVTVEILAAHGVAAFKVGRDLAGLLRPDKLVAYLRSRDEVAAVATDLAAALRGCPAHGVPFTARLTGDGLLSWGSDPPVVVGSGPESWRTWVTGRLAHAMVRAGANAPVPSWQFAVSRLSLDGVEPWTWEASAVDWLAAR